MMLSSEWNSLPEIKFAIIILIYFTVTWDADTEGVKGGHQFECRKKNYAL